MALEGDGYFPVVSIEDAEEDEGSTPPDAGKTDLKDEWVVRESDQESPIGVLHLHLTRPRKRLNDVDVWVCRVVFDFGDGDTLSASGILPAVGTGHVVGDGRLAIVGGTGAFKGQLGQLVVSIVNPKRWSIDDSP